MELIPNSSFLVELEILPINVSVSSDLEGWLESLKELLGFLEWWTLTRL